MINDQIDSKITAITVTYHKDFAVLERLLRSIEIYSQTKFNHIIVLNDSEEYLESLHAITKKYQSKTVYHWKQFARMTALPRTDDRFGARHDNCGWMTQQMLTLVLAEIVPTDYYVNLVSKDFFVESYNLNHMIANDAVMTNFEIFKNLMPDYNDQTPQWFQYWINAYQFFDLNPWSYMDKTLIPHTPYMLITEYVRSMFEYLDQIDVSILDIIGYNLDPENTHLYNLGKDKTVEVYLYSAWLAKLQKTDRLAHNWYIDVNTRPDLHIRFERST